MCGIVTLMSSAKTRISIDHKKFLMQGLMIDTLRGDHSTGLAFVDKDGIAETYKKAVPGYDFVHLKTPSRVINNITDFNYIIGHNRYATKGAINSLNAHPFQHGAITGVHNGSLREYHSLAPQQNFATDSEHVIWALNQADDVGDVIKKLKGAFTLVWHDEQDNTIHMIRNEDRPFHLAYMEKEDTILGISEVEMLNLLIARNKIKIEKIVELPVGEEWVFSQDDLKNPAKIEREFWTPPKFDSSSQRRGAGSGSYTSPSQKVHPPADSRQKSDWERQVDAELRILGLKRDEEVEFIIQDYSIYPGTGNGGYMKYGELTGYMVDAPYMEVQVTGLGEETYNRLTGWSAKSRVIRAIRSGRKQRIVLTAKDIDNVSEEEDIPFDQIAKANKVEKEKEETDGNVKKSVTGGHNVLYLDSSGRCYTKKQAVELLKHGCGMCSRDLEPSEMTSLSWAGDSPICPECAEQMEKLDK
jgi:glucosamine 6-phosphate synthetase-like amidotransferase/phosphosugar isomerase protein